MDDHTLVALTIMIAESRPEENSVVHNKHNAPGIIKYSFWKMTRERTHTSYACLNKGEA